MGKSVCRHKIEVKLNTEDDLKICTFVIVILHFLVSSKSFLGDVSPHFITNWLVSQGA